MGKWSSIILISRILSLHQTGYSEAGASESTPKIAILILHNAASSFPKERLDVYVNEYHNQPAELLGQPLH
jgi:hypothetical protein